MSNLSRISGRPIDRSVDTDMENTRARLEFIIEYVYYRESQTRETTGRVVGEFNRYFNLMKLWLTFKYVLNYPV